MRAAVDDWDAHVDFPTTEVAGRRIVATPDVDGWTVDIGGVLLTPAQLTELASWAHDLGDAL